MISEGNEAVIGRIIEFRSSAASRNLQFRHLSTFTTTISVSCPLVSPPLFLFSLLKPRTAALRRIHRPPANPPVVPRPNIPPAPLRHCSLPRIRCPPAVPHRTAQFELI
ncbi:hypothetical protein V2J09_004525 [Rumex salicifolius]